MSCDSANSFFSGDFYRTLSDSSAADGLISAPSHYKGGGSVGGFLSCTETLGFESTDDGSSIDGYNNNNNHHIRCGFESARKRTRERSAEERRGVKFPLPLTSLNRYGWPSFVLRPVRRDGRLELTEVKIHRPEVICASRQNGRLTIHLLKYADDQEDQEEEE